MDLVPEGRLRVAQDAVLGTMHITTKSPARDWSLSRISSQDCVLGYSQPHLFKLIREDAFFDLQLTTKTSS